MKLDVEFGGLDAVRRTLRAPERPFASAVQLSEFERIGIALEGGIEIDVADVAFRDGLPTYKGHHVVLYIKDMTFRPDAITDVKARRRLHVSSCSTITGMTEKGKLDKYVATTRRDGQFEVSLSDGRRKFVAERDLLACQNCLKELGYKGFDAFGSALAREITEDFDLDEFFEAYSSKFDRLPRHTPASMGSTDYPPDWVIISRRLRKKAGWRCDGCGVDLSSKRELLDAHHVNTVRSDCRDENLRPLCKVCHAAQPDHKHVEKLITRSQRMMIDQLRRRQGL